MNMVAKRVEQAFRPMIFILALAMSLHPVQHAAAQDNEDQQGPPPTEIPEGSVGGMGDINLYPKRVVIDQRQRIASIGLFNRTIDPGEYEISIIDMVMSPTGEVFRLDNLPAGVSSDRLKAASDFLRWSPRRVRLLGSEAQTVRIMARPPAGLADGEYRSHFLAVSVPQDVDQGLTIEGAVSDDQDAGSDIGVLIRPRFGISIPIIVRVGETSLDVALDGFRFVETPQGTAIALTIRREGTRSAFGDITITAPGIGEPVATARGVGVYPEIDSRELLLGFNNQFDTSLLRSGMVLTATYVDDDFAPGKSLASSDFTVP